MESRIQKEQKPEGLLIKIKAYKEETKQKILTVWMLTWTLCGAAIISQVFFEPEDDLKSMLLIFTAFWAYFEYIVVKAYRWRRAGEEQILITDSQFHYGRTVKNRGFLKPYRIDFINGVKRAEENPTSFLSAFSDSYWVVGNEKLFISVQGKLIYFGTRLSEKEANQLMKTLNQELDKRTK